MALAEYHRKRSFDQTQEPKGKVKKAGHKLIFVVQQHAASHLHYDFRLEMEGVLKSWAVPKGPSMNPDDKRLAMMVEDHPFDYKDFEGKIPKGNYGAGHVIVWDTGTYHIAGSKTAGEKELLAGLHRGHIRFVLKGKKLKGEFALVQMKGGESNAWLLVKKQDEYAGDIDILKKNKSVHSGKTLEQLSGDKDITKPKGKRRPAKPDPVKKTAAKKKLPEKEEQLSYDTTDPKVISIGKNGAMPAKVKPMLAEITDKPFDDTEWIFESKFDGYRAVANVAKGQVELYSRNMHPFNADYPEVVNALAKLQHTAVLDGEVVAEGPDGRDHFQLLQNRGNNNVRIRYHVFDLLQLNGYDLSPVPLVQRKSLLKKLLAQLRSRIIVYSDYTEGKGVAAYKKAMRENREGIIAKQAQSPYRYGVRSREWLKIKIHQQQEAVIAGITEPRGSREHFGALVLAVREGDQWKYIGHCGTGFTQQTLKELVAKFRPYFMNESPFKTRVPLKGKVQWMHPHFVCQVRFSEWTGDDHLRQPVFLGLRTDKKAMDVTREKPIPHAGTKKAARKSTRKKP